MSDQGSTETAGQGSSDDVYVAAAAVGDENGLIAAAAVISQGKDSIVMARFADMDTAKTAYEALREDQQAGDYKINGVLVVNADAEGKVHVQKMTDHSTREGLKWGAIAGVVVGVIFPPSILGSALVLGAGGATVGKIRERVHKNQVAGELQSIITPGTSGIVALVESTASDVVTKDLKEAQAVKALPVDEETTEEIKKAAAEAS